MRHNGGYIRVRGAVERPLGTRDDTVRTISGDSIQGDLSFSWRNYSEPCLEPDE